MVIGMKKRRAVDSYFQAIKDKVRGDTNVMMLCGNGSFPPSSKEEDSVPTGSIKRHFLTRSAGKHRTSRVCPFCQKNDLVPVTADGGVQESDTSLEWRSCAACNLAGGAGRSEGTARRVMQRDKLAALNTRRGGSANVKGKKQACGVQSAEYSL